MFRGDLYMDSPAEQITQTIERPTSRRGFLAGISKLLAGGMILPFLSLEPVPAHAAEQHSNKRKTPMNKPDLSLVSMDSASIAGEPVAYPNTPSPEISSYIMPIAPGATTQWMTHPVPAYLYVLEGTLTVEFAEDGSRKEFKAGQAFLQARTKWHRGRNDGTVPVRFLAVFCGAKDVPNVLHPPQV
jgi:quercetin dioxygenase-like cupin family protein